MWIRQILAVYGTHSSTRHAAATSAAHATGVNLDQIKRRPPGPLPLTMLSGYDSDKHKIEDIVTKIAKYTFYLSIIKCLEIFPSALYEFKQTRKKDKVIKLLNLYKTSLLAFGISTAVLIATKKALFEIELVLLTVAAFATKHPEMSQKPPSVSYGTGMACSFYEGYLTHVIPGDGGVNVGITKNIVTYEASGKVSFPVKRLFLVITKSLRCPPQLSDFNRENAEELGITFLEACLPLQDVKKDVAGVKDRVYRNSVYKVVTGGGRSQTEPAQSARRRPHVVAECATPLHTMHKVMNKRAIFEDLRDADFDEIREDFCRMLLKILETPECRGKCELVYYDDTDPTQNLADIILEKIKKLEPNYEELLTKPN